jgi:hypothetical protein
VSDDDQVGPLRRNRHFASRVPSEVEKNIARLASDWSEATRAAVTDLEHQAAAWANEELATLNRTLVQSLEHAAQLGECIANLDNSGAKL